jgi:hypothetical protein
MTRQTVNIDPAVAAILGESEQRAQMRTMTPAQRQRAQRQARRKSVTYEMHADLVAIVREIADAMEISPAAVVNRLLLDALRRYADGEIDFEDYLEPSRSPRYLWVVKIDPKGLRAAVAQRLAEELPDGDGEDCR